MQPAPAIEFSAGDDVSRRVAGMMLGDTRLGEFAGSEVERTAFLLGRAAAYLLHIFDVKVKEPTTFAEVAAQAVAGKASLTVRQSRMIEAAIVASADHGVTPPRRRRRSCSARSARRLKSPWPGA